LVRAWFNVGADFLIQFKPFHYDASLYVAMGAQATLHFFGTHHLSFDASANVHLWGPPLAGEAHVSLKVLCFRVKFDVDFGAGPPLAKPIDWTTFTTSFSTPQRQRHRTHPAARQPPAHRRRPAARHPVDRICRNRPPGQRADGLLRSVVNPRDCMVQVASAMPSAIIQLLDHQLADNTPYGIRPMGLGASGTDGAATGPTMVITIHDDVAQSAVGHDWTVAPQSKSMPMALWGWGKPTTAICCRQTSTPLR
jgi:hypothetical protein